jgi:hypothetical protein
MMNPAADSRGHGGPVDGWGSLLKGTQRADLASMAFGSEAQARRELAEGGKSIHCLQGDVASVNRPTSASEAAAGEFIRAQDLVRPCRRNDQTDFEFRPSNSKAISNRR